MKIELSIEMIYQEEPYWDNTCETVNAASKEMGVHLDLSSGINRRLWQCVSPIMTWQVERMLNLVDHVSICQDSETLFKAEERRDL